MPDKVHFLCSCPEYLHGTGKPTKKKTTCKQCKGIKLPFAPIGGTVRMISTPYVLDATTARNCVGTVRLPSTTSTSFTRQRPTILCGEHDPYDFLRQSRLLLANESNELNVPSYPQNYQTIGPSSHALMRGNRSFLPNKAPRIIESFTPLIPDVYRNRSILQATINPYELISSTLHNNEFSPSSHLYDFLQSNSSNSKKSSSNSTVAIRNNYRNEPNRYTVMETFASPPANDVAKQKPATSSTQQSIQPPPVPALESLPLSVKTISNKTMLQNVDIGKKVDVITAATPQQTSITTTPTVSATSKYKSILKSSISTPNGTVNSLNGVANNRLTTIDKVNSKQNLSHALNHEARPALMKSSLQKSNPKINGSLPSRTTLITPSDTLSRGGIKKIIKEPNNRRVESATGTTGRYKKVQFNTEPTIDRPKSNESSQSNADEKFSRASNDSIDSKESASCNENSKTNGASHKTADTKLKFGLRSGKNEDFYLFLTFFRI